MKKRVLVVANNMEIGGAERALLGLLDAFDTEKYSVDLFLLKHTGTFLKLIPKKINLLPENASYSCLGVPMSEIIKKGHFLMAAGRCIGKFRASIHIKKRKILIQNSVGLLYSYKYTKIILPKLSEKKYDLAIGFTLPYYIVDEKCIAAKKVVWIHTDYSKEYADKKNEIKAWKVYDYLIAVSKDVAKSFASIYPSLSSKTKVIHNIVSAEIIRKQAEQFMVDEEMDGNEDTVIVLSIGRFCPAKNFDNVPFICKEIKKLGIKVKWFLIGYGNSENLIKCNIKKANVEDEVIILGKKENPYPYIKKCDIYVQPSRVEGRCVTVTEAQILNKPVIITNYATSKSQLEDGYDGVIVPMDNEGCAEGIAKVINDKKLRETLIENTKKTDYTNHSEINKLYDLI